MVAWNIQLLGILATPVIHLAILPGHSASNVLMVAVKDHAMTVLLAVDVLALNSPLMLRFVEILEKNSIRNVSVHTESFTIECCFKILRQDSPRYVPNS